MEQVVQELIKASPFAAMCILALILVNNSHKNSLKELKEVFDSSIKTIKEAYKEGMELTRTAMLETMSKKIK